MIGLQYHTLSRVCFARLHLTDFTWKISDFFLLSTEQHHHVSKAAGIEANPRQGLATTRTENVLWL